MLTKTKTAIVAAMLLGSVSGSALANNSQFDVNIYRPAQQHNAVDAYARESTQAKDRTDPRAVKPFTIEEKLWMDRASQRS
jgi:hypothetical protein